MSQARSLITSACGDQDKGKRLSVHCTVTCAPGAAPRATARPGMARPPSAGPDPPAPARTTARPKRDAAPDLMFKVLTAPGPQECSLHSAGIGHAFDACTPQQGTGAGSCSRIGWDISCPETLQRLKIHRPTKSLLLASRKAHRCFHQCLTSMTPHTSVGFCSGSWQPWCAAASSSQSSGCECCVALSKANSKVTFGGYSSPM